VTSALRHTRQKAWATDARTRNLQARQTNLHDRLSRLVFQIDQALPPEGSADASTTADIIHKLESSKLELEGTSKRGKESLRAQVNHLRGRIAELRRFPVRQDQDVGWLADPEAQAQIGEVRFSSVSSLTMTCSFSFSAPISAGQEGTNDRFSDNINWHWRE
jgi:hypothetical protein